MQNRDIAIIGIAGKYPEAGSPEELWQHILSHRDLSSSPTKKREEKNFVNKYYGVDRIGYFDHKRFHFTPLEATLTDPQHRILLTSAYNALLDAGTPNEPPHLKFGVFATTSISTYLLNVLLKDDRYKINELNYPVLIGNDKDFLATKIAYKLNFTGPAITIQCACSSSLVAIHHACQSLLNGECDQAIAGAVSLSVPQEQGYFYKEGGILSADGICRPFDRDANGTIKGNGCSVLILKRLVDAVHDKNRIYALIKGTAINNDGANKVGFTAPSILGQSAVIHEALDIAGLLPGDIGYIEAHGTGTKLGDLVELAALFRVFERVKKKIPVGSIKANIGHLDVASGITSVIKSIFTLRSGLIPALHHFQILNPELKEFSNPFDFPAKHINQKIMHCSVSSFGIGGTNAHAIIGRYEKEEPWQNHYRFPEMPLEETEFWLYPEAAHPERQKDERGICLEVIEIWRKSLGESLIQKDSHYIDLGGDSLMALDIIDAIRQRFRVDLNLTIFQNLLTPIKLAAWIEKQAVSKGPSAFIPLREPKESQRSLFLIHPAGGTTFCYSHLNPFIKGDYNLFVIDLPDAYTQYKSMEELGAFYLQELKKIEPKGPYFLGGYSFGGNLSYEMVLQLTKQKEDVAKVILFDSHPPEAYWPSPSERDIDYQKAFSHILSYFPQSERFSKEAYEAFCNKWIYSHKLLKNHYQSDQIPCNITLFAAEEKENELILNLLQIKHLSKEIWKSRTQALFKNVKVFGNHYTMFQSDCAPILSKLLDEEMR